MQLGLFWPCGTKPLISQVQADRVKEGAKLKTGRGVDKGRLAGGWEGAKDAREEGDKYECFQGKERVNRGGGENEMPPEVLVGSLLIFSTV